MKMTSSVCLLALTALAMATVTTACLTSSCCMPHEFQAVITELVPVNQLIYEYTRIGIDYPAEKMVFLTYVRDTTTTPMTNTFVSRRVLDFSSAGGMSYTTDSSGSCSSQSDTTIPWRCVPANATCLGDTYMGFNVGGLPASFYRFPIPGSPSIVSIGFHRQRVLNSFDDVCVPLVQVIAGSATRASGKPFIFTDFSPCLNNDFNMTIGC